MTESPNTRVSVVTAAYNAENTIAECIASIQAQTISDWEMIVIDDCSTDRTHDIVRQLASADQRVRLHRFDRNRGSGACRNQAIQMSGSPYVAVMDADDVSMPDRLAVQLAFAAKHPDAVAIASQLEEFGDWGGPEPSRWPTDASKIIELQNRHRMPLPHPSCVFQRAAILTAGGYDEKCRRAQDYALFLKLGNAEMHTLDQILVSYRTNRPITLQYAIDSGRYGLLARQRALEGKDFDKPRTLPRSLPVDVRSTIQWTRRALRERA